MYKPAYRRFHIPGDKWVLWLSFLLAIAGLVTIFDASYAASIRRGEGSISTEVTRQLMWLAVACAVYWRVAKTRWTDLRRFSGLAFAIVLLLCVLVFVPGIGYSVRGAQRWVNFRFGNLQPSELMKPIVILFAAGLLTRTAQASKRKIRDWVDWVDHRGIPWLVRNRGWIAILVALLLIEKQPDLGSAFAVGLALFGTLLLGGVSWKKLTAIVLVGIVIVAALTVSKGYRTDRFQDPWETANGVGFQPTQSLTAMAVGGVLGVGAAHGQAKYVLPAATTDYAFTTIAEETGLAGALILTLLLAALSVRLLAISASAPTPWCRIVIGSVGWWIGIQSAFNILMVAGALPSVGIPLPFISYGGSSALALAIGLGAAHSCTVAVEKLEGSRAIDRNRRRYGRARFTRA